ncbi:MAG: polysaccharide biosynthesis/export family protein, partial [Phycisphaerae bacterium]
MSLAFGCADSSQEMRHFLRAHEHVVSGVEYRLAPPDAIFVSSAQAPEIDGEIQVIRPDGKISMRLLGEVKVSGLSTQEIAHKLESLLTRYYVRPQVSVRVAAYRSKHVYVFGQVSRKGALPYTGRDTLLHVVARAQPTFLAWKARTKVIRPGPEAGSRHEVIVDLDKLLTEGDTEKNFLLQEGDIVYVPPTPLAWVGLRIRELLFPVAPVAQAIIAPAAVKSAVDVYEDGGD